MDLSIEVSYCSLYIDIHHIRQHSQQVTGPSSEKTTNDLLHRGYQIILSHNDAWDLGAGFSGLSGLNSMSSKPELYSGWQKVYSLSPSSGTSNLVGSGKSDLVLGGEAVLWSHHVDDANIDAKVSISS